MHEYGGGAWWRHGETVVCSSFDDSRLYRIDSAGAEPLPTTPEPEQPNALRYADGRVLADGRLLLCVRETHGDGEPRNELVALPLDGSSEPRVVAAGRDFYAAPRPSPDGRQVAWTSWDHPQMPFEGTELWVADLATDGSFTNERHVAGGPTESIVQPEWSSEGVLHFASDRTGWWNLYAEQNGDVIPLCPADAEFASPPWAFGMTRYSFLDDGRIACVVTRRAIDTLELLDPRTGTLEPVDLPYTSYGASIGSRGNVVVCVAASPTDAAAIIAFDVRSGAREAIRRSSEHRLDDRQIARPEPIEFPGAGGEPSYAFYYPPTNADFEAPEDERPPLVVSIHGGPTAHVATGLSLGLQFFTSRGIAVVQVNYGGSTGYGRAYRDRLRHRWGIVDVEDSAAAARHLAARGAVGPERIEITGGSAGGYTTLLALALRDEFAAGASYFGVADLVTFHAETHKFESHYDEYLVGRWPDQIDVYRDRSPVTHADGIQAPLLLLQGLDDKVVPPSQAEQIVDVLEQRGVPYAYIAFEGEGHGFRKAENVKRAIEAHLAFLAHVFGFEPADRLEPIAIQNLEKLPT